jgi:hypothetical protein
VQTDATSLRGGCATSSVSYNSSVVWLACDCLWETASGCGGVLRMGLCRACGDGDGGGGADLCLKPCLGWGPSENRGGGLLWNLRDCGGGHAPCSHFFRGNALSRLSWADGRRCRGGTGWVSLWQRVAQVTLAWLRRCAPAGVL